MKQKKLTLSSPNHPFSCTNQSLFEADDGPLPRVRGGCGREQDQHRRGPQDYRRQGERRARGGGLGAGRRPPGRPPFCNTHDSMVVVPNTVDRIKRWLLLFPPKIFGEVFWQTMSPRVCVSLTLFPLAITRRSPRSLRAVGGHREQVRRDHLRRGRRGARVAVRHRRRRHQLHPRGKSDWVFRPPQAPWFSQANPAARKVFTDKISQ